MSHPIMSRIVVYGAIATIFFVAAAAKAQVATPNVTGLPTAVKIYTFTDKPVWDVVYTDRKGCVAKVNENIAEVIADSAGPDQVFEGARVYRINQGNHKVGDVDYQVFVNSKHYDLTKESDLITRQCGAMIKAIPETEITKKLFLKLVIE